MFNPSLQSLLVQAHVEELQRAAHTYNRGRNVNRGPAAALATLRRRAINRIFAGAQAVNDKAAPLSGFELVGHSSAATLKPRS